MWLNSFIARLRDCLENGELIPFSEATPEQMDRTETGSVLLYVDDPASRNYMDIVLDFLIYDLHNDVVSTFSDMLKNIDDARKTPKAVQVASGVFFRGCYCLAAATCRVRFGSSSLPFRRRR